MPKRMNPREARRMMQRMGMNMDGLDDVKEVLIRTSNKEISIEQPQVSILEMQGQKIFQIIGGKVNERAPESTRSQFSISEEDAKLVADQTGRSIEEAKNALEECEGDLAKAILLLQS
jgi:nascent polypeptide-associated complex subunit alpha